MVGAEARALVERTPLPDGYAIEVQVMRRYRYRDEIRFVVRKDAMPVDGWQGATNPEKGLDWLVRRIEKDVGWAGVVVTTDSEGWVRSIEEVA